MKTNGLTKLYEHLLPRERLPCSWQPKPEGISRNSTA